MKPSRNPMKLRLTSLAVMAGCLAWFPGTGLAGSRSTQNHDGAGSTSSDPHGNQTTVAKPGTESPVGSRPHGESENRSSFGTPLPPNNLTPAPILPLSPNRALSPTAPPSGYTPPSGGNRIGR